MKAFKELTKGGKKRRLRKVVEEAIKHYDLDALKIDYFTEATSIFFKIEDIKGRKFALKLFQDASSTLEDNLAELFLIDTIAEKTNILVPEVVKTLDGEGVLVLDTKYLEKEQRITVYRWLSGIEADDNETDNYFYQLGVVCAKMHEATKNIIIPKSLSPKKWDRVFYFRGEEAVYKEDKLHKYLDTEFHETMDYAIDYLNKALMELYEQSEPQLIHGDLNPWNVLIDGEELNVLDFEDALYGYPIHDLAIILFYYRHDDAFDYESVKTKVLQGYSSIRTLPEVSDYLIDLLIIARRVNFINYVLTFDEIPVDYLKTNIPRVRKFFTKYVETCPF